MSAIGISCNEASVLLEAILSRSDLATIRQLGLNKKIANPTEHGAQWFCGVLVSNPNRTASHFLLDWLRGKSTYANVQITGASIWLDVRLG